MTWNWRKQYARLLGNWLTSFGTPLIGSVAVTNDFGESVLIALITSSIVTCVVAGKMYDEWSKTDC